MYYEGECKNFVSIWEGQWTLSLPFNASLFVYYKRLSYKPIWSIWSPRNECIVDTDVKMQMAIEISLVFCYIHTYITTCKTNFPRVHYTPCRGCGRCMSSMEFSHSLISISFRPEHFSSKISFLDIKIGRSIIDF